MPRAAAETARTYRAAASDRDPGDLADRLRHLGDRRWRAEVAAIGGRSWAHGAGIDRIRVAENADHWTRQRRRKMHQPGIDTHSEFSPRYQGRHVIERQPRRDNCSGVCRRDPLAASALLTAAPR